MKEHEATVTVRLPAHLITQLRVRSEAEGVSVSQGVRRAVAAWVSGPGPARVKAETVSPAVRRAVPAAASVVEALVETVAQVKVCRRCGHNESSHWVKGCLAGCVCSEGRYLPA